MMHEFGRCQVNTPAGRDERQIVYWHRDLPPLRAEVIADHSVEANSTRVPGTIAYRDELWNRCYRELMATAESRVVQEIAPPGRRSTSRESIRGHRRRGRQPHVFDRERPAGVAHRDRGADPSERLHTKAVHDAARCRGRFRSACAHGIRSERRRRRPRVVTEQE